MRWPWKNLEEKASKAGKLIAMSVVGRAVFTPRNYEKLAKESYVRNAVAFRAVAEIAKCAGSVPFNLFRGTGTSQVELEKHPLLDLLKRPNPCQSRVELIQAIVAFYLLAGNSYLERVGPRGQQAPRELWTKRPDRMKVIPGAQGVPQAFQFSIGQGKPVVWPVNTRNGQSEILHIKAFHPLDDWYGMSAVEAAAYSVDQHNEAGKWNMGLLQNSARPSGALIVDPKSATGLDDRQYNRLKAEIEDKYAGGDFAGRPMLLEGGLDWKEMGINPTDMDWLQGKHTSARDIAMVFGMPAQMLGIPGDNTHRNMEEARLWLWEQTIIPLLDLILEQLNWWLVPLFGEDLVLKFDLDSVPALISRRHMLWDKVSSSDFLTVDEKREATGYEPLPEGAGEVVLVPSKNHPLGEEPEPEPDADDDPDKKSGSSKIVRIGGNS